MSEVGGGGGWVGGGKGGRGGGRRTGYSLNRCPIPGRSPAPYALVRPPPGALLFGRPLALRRRTHRPYRADRPTGYPPLVVSVIRYAMPALGTTVAYGTALHVPALRVPA